MTSVEIKRLRSLKEKSVRDEFSLFAVEGDRAINELISAGLTPKEYYSVKDGTITELQLQRISSLKSPQGSFAVFEKPYKGVVSPKKDKLSILLDDIQDPGNLGTIIRTCDWFGITDIYASMKTADCYNPKVIQSTMGAIARVRVMYTDLCALIDTVNMPVYGTFMNDAVDIYSLQEKPKGTLLVVGNEGNGISEFIASRVTCRITIPAFSSSHVESLNVSVATAIAISELMRS